jgi:heme-degrading monooxygenase HmoA
MIHQLRIYEIFENNKDSFHKRFRDHASRIMRSYGFDIKATWETKNGNRTEFIYLLAWPDEKTMQHAWERFRADEEWRKIKRDTNVQYGDLVGEIQERILRPVSQDMFVLQTSP